MNDIEDNVYAFGDALTVDSAEPPEWIPLGPAGYENTGSNGAKWLIDDAETIKNNFNRRKKLKIDFEHASQVKGGQGERVPAAGWITELDMSDVAGKGIWGKAEWTKAGAESWANRDYSAFSPAARQRKSDGGVIEFLSVGLVSVPNFGELTLNSLHREEPMNQDLTKEILSRLGLPQSEDRSVVLHSVDAVVAKATRAGELENAAQGLLTKLNEVQAQLDTIKESMRQKEEQDINGVIEEAVHSFKIEAHAIESEKEIIRKLGVTEYRNKVLNRITPTIKSERVSTHSYVAPKSDAEGRDRELASAFGVDLETYLTELKGKV